MVIAREGLENTETPSEFLTEEDKIELDRHIAAYQAADRLHQIEADEAACASCTKTGECGTCPHSPF
jgi:hypothetical protein